MLLRLGNIDDLDLNLFAFDYDLTFAAFFLNADGKVYARYGQRDGKSAEDRQSLKGLAHTMQSVLDMHARPEPAFAPRDDDKAVTISDVAGRSRRCYHCHNVKERLDAKLKRDGKWDREMAFRFPPPEVVGLGLEVDRGNVVGQVGAGSAAAAAGLKKGDVLTRLGGVPVHSQADAMFALDRAPAKGKVELTYTRDGQAVSVELALEAGWRRHDLSWRPSMKKQLASLPIYGEALGVDDKKKLGLGENQLAVRQRASVHSKAKALGIQPGDIIVGLDGRAVEGKDDARLRKYVSGHYLLGDSARVDVIRDGKRMSLEVTFR